VGKSKTVAGTGRVIPLNDTVMVAIEDATLPGTSGGSVSVGRSGMFSPPEKGSRMIPPTPLRR